MKSGSIGGLYFSATVSVFTYTPPTKAGVLLHCGLQTLVIFIYRDNTTLTGLLSLKSYIRTDLSDPIGFFHNTMWWFTSHINSEIPPWNNADRHLMAMCAVRKRPSVTNDGHAPRMCSTKIDLMAKGFGPWSEEASWKLVISGQKCPYLTPITFVKGILCEVPFFWGGGGIASSVILQYRGHGIM